MTTMMMSVATLLLVKLSFKACVKVHSLKYSFAEVDRLSINMHCEESRVALAE